MSIIVQKVGKHVLLRGGWDVPLCTAWIGATSDELGGSADEDGPVELLDSMLDDPRQKFLTVGQLLDYALECVVELGSNDETSKETVSCCRLLGELIAGWDAGNQAGAPLVEWAQRVSVTIALEEGNVVEHLGEIDVAEVVA